MAGSDIDRCDDQHGEDEEMGGVYIGGSMSGGAIATGTDSTAEDSSLKDPSAEASGPPAPTARPTSSPEGQFVVAGHVTGGAASVGKGSEARYRAAHVAVGQQLLDRLACARRDLAKLERTIEVEAAEGELDAAEREIRSQGARRGVLRRLLDLFQGGSAVLREAETATQVVETLQGAWAALDSAHGDR